MNHNDGRVVSNFIVQALNNVPITINGDGSQTRSFCSVDALAAGFIRLMNTDDAFTGPVNLGNPGEFTILELAEKIIKMVGSDSVIDFQTLPSDDPRQRKPDITLAGEKLGWKPEIDLETGLVPAIKYFKSLKYDKRV